jgi:hypothetical protein
MGHARTVKEQARQSVREEVCKRLVWCNIDVGTPQVMRGPGVMWLQRWWYIILLHILRVEI